MSSWTHPMCGQCWFIQYWPRAAFRLVEAVRCTELCCWCGTTTRSGIYVRADPATLPRHNKEHL